MSLDDWKVVFIVNTVVAELFIIANAMNNFGWISLG